MRLAPPYNFSVSRTSVWAHFSKTENYLCNLWMADDGRKRQQFDGSFWGSQTKREKYSCLDSACHPAGSANDVLLDSTFYMEPLGSVSVSLSADHLTWQALEDRLSIGISCCWGRTDENDDINQLALSEIYGVESIESSLQGRTESQLSHSFSGELFKEEHHFTVHAYQKSSSQKGTWMPKTFVFHHTDQVVCKRWANRLETLLEADIRRPRNLLVIINPHSGRNSASKTWEEVSPLFKRAKINTNVLTTKKSRHAFEVINSFLDEDLAKLDGIVVVGGDGLFNEVLNGLLLRRHRAIIPMKPNDHENSGGSGSLFPTSADRSPLLSSDMAETISVVSSDTSMESLLVDVHSPNLIPVSHSSSCRSIPSLDYDLIFYKDGGFVIPRGSQTCYQEDKQTSGVSFPNPHFRIGIIPAGSTDSIAISTTGSRNAVTCAFHIIFGEKMPLDIVRLISWKSSRISAEESPRVRYAASFAGYGFYGDVIRESEPNRWMGPMRYDYAGTKVFFRHKLYGADISYVESPRTDFRIAEPGCSASENTWLPKKSGRLGSLSRTACRLNCNICRNGIDSSYMDEAASKFSSSENCSKWKHVRGSFISVGAAVISCRNEKAPNGVAARAHLADGLLHLILVKDCSRLSYLWHLIQLTREDTDPLDFAFVEEHRTPQFDFVSHGEESVWNVDGELFPAHRLSAKVFRGLINIFASGPDI